MLTLRLDFDSVLIEAGMTADGSGPCHGSTTTKPCIPCLAWILQE